MFVVKSNAQTDSTIYNDSILHYTFCEFDVELDSCSYSPLYNELTSWIGTKYKYAGNSNKGVDCSGFVKRVYKKTYNIKLLGGSRHIYTQTQPLEIENLEQGDLVFFKINKPSISHIGIYLKDGYFIHASVKSGVTINNLNESYYKKYFYTGGKFTLR